MEFLSAVASRFPLSNNQLRTSSNPRNQASIQDGRVTVQQVQRRQHQSYTCTGNKGIATRLKGNAAVGPSRVVKYYNCQGEGHMARQCTQPKRPRNAAWFKEKLMLAKAQKRDVQEMQYSEQTHVDDFEDNEIHSGSNIIPYSHTTTQKAINTLPKRLVM
ncbi:UBN2 domain-containing protein [Tanacetum coccineum]